MEVTINIFLGVGSLIFLLIALSCFCHVTTIFGLFLYTCLSLIFYCLIQEVLGLVSLGKIFFELKIMYVKE